MSSTLSLWMGLSVWQVIKSGIVIGLARVRRGCHNFRHSHREDLKKMVLLEHRPEEGGKSIWGQREQVEVPRDGRAPVCVMKGRKSEGLQQSKQQGRGWGTVTRSIGACGSVSEDSDLYSEQNWELLESVQQRRDMI